MERIPHGGFIPAGEIHSAYGAFKKHVAAEKKAFRGSVVRSAAGSVARKQEALKGDGANLHSISVLHKHISGWNVRNAANEVRKAESRVVEPVGFELWDSKQGVREEAFHVRTSCNMVGMCVGDEYAYQISMLGLHKPLKGRNVSCGVNNGGFLA